MADWKAFLRKLEKEGKDVPDPKALAEFLKEARDSSVAFLKDAAADVQRYLGLVAEGKLNGGDLALLLEGIRRQTRAEIAVQKAKAQLKLRGFLENVLSVLLNKLVKALV